MKTKIIAAYLPQFHRTKENDQMWGEGFTDWVAVKKAKPVYDGQIQPRVPLNSHYYSLDNVEEIKNQANLARKYGIYGFGIYHYWMSSKQQLLTKPCELLLAHKEIDIHYLFIWDNISWRRTWSAVHGNAWAPAFDGDSKDPNNNGLLVELVYGDENEWKKHFECLLPYFKDERYIKENNMPVFLINNPGNDSDTVVKMTHYLNNLSKQYGFNGIKFIANITPKRIDIPFKYIFQPFNVYSLTDRIERKLRKVFVRNNSGPKFYNYDTIWKKIIIRAKMCHDDKVYYGGLVQYDDTPRRGEKASIILNSNSSKFGSYLTRLLEISKKQNKEYLFLFAWNEWGEGNYLEPDEHERYSYLEALKQALIDSKNCDYD